jgi:release factor glutamine methyltransferase
MILKDILTFGKKELKNTSATPLLDTQIICEYCLSVPTEYLMTHEHITVQNISEEEIKLMIQQRKKGMPIAYLIKQKDFFHQTFYVDNNVLIPRPETEELIEYVLGYFPHTPFKVLDLGTGSGCIAITLKKERPQFQVSASDISLKALNIAKKNAKTLQQEIHLIQSDLLFNIKESFDLIIANLPYVENKAKDPSIFYEPNIALYSGADGLDHYRTLSQQISKKNCKHLIIEIDDKQAEKIKDIFPQAKQIHIMKDLSHYYRFAHIIL